MTDNLDVELLNERSISTDSLALYLFLCESSAHVL